MTYPRAEETFAAADAKTELAETLLTRAVTLAEGDPGWLYLTKTRKLPAGAVRAALGELRLIEPLIPGREPVDYAVASLLRDRDGNVSGLQLTFHDVTGAASATAPKRQTYSVRERGVRDGLFHAGGGEGDRAFIAEGYLEKAIALAALGLGPAYGAGARPVLGCAPPPEAEVVLVTDRRPDGKVVDLKSGRSEADRHDLDMQRAVDLLLLAGKAVSITPDPPACPHGCKDPDDVLVKHGDILLAEWVESAAPVDGLSIDGEARRIAKIVDPLDRDRETTVVAKRLKVRVGMLREAVRKHHDGETDRGPEDTASGSALTFEAVQPATEPQDGAQLLDAVAEAIGRHAFLDQADRTKAVLWSVHNHRRFHQNVAVLPRLLVTAAGEDSGKTTLAATLSHLGDVMELLTDPTAAVIFRAIEACNCGFMLDEVDAWWHRDEALRSILNSGFTLEGARVLRVEDTGSGGRRVLEPRRYSTFAPIAAVGIKLDRVLPRTLISRSLVITMRPARVGDVPEDLFGSRPAVARLRALAGRIKRWIADNEIALSVAEPRLPPGLINRVRLIWRPLLAIADAAGGDWPELARAALEVDRSRMRDPSLAEQLLLDVRDILAKVKDGRAYTGTILEKLTAMELRSWSVFGKARAPIRDLDVANLLRPYEVRSVQLKIGGHNRWGYRLVDIIAAIDRYMAHSDVPRGSKTHYPATGWSEPSETAAYNGSGGVATSTLPPDAPLPREGFPAEVAATQKPDTTAFREQVHHGSGVAASEGVHFHSEVQDSGNGQNDPVQSSAVRCVDCGAVVPKPARGPTAKRCPECRAKRGSSPKPREVLT